MCTFCLAGVFQRPVLMIATLTLVFLNAIELGLSDTVSPDFTQSL